MVGLVKLIAQVMLSFGGVFATCAVGYAWETNCGGLDRCQTGLLQHKVASLLRVVCDTHQCAMRLHPHTRNCTLTRTPAPSPAHPHVHVVWHAFASPPGLLLPCSPAGACQRPPRPPRLIKAARGAQRSASASGSLHRPAQRVSCCGHWPRRSEAAQVLRACCVQRDGAFASDSQAQGQLV